MADPRIKQLKIKTGIVKRIAKERVYYDKEKDKEMERLEKFRSEGADEHVLRKQQEVINESLAMGPDTKRRLIAARDDLSKYLTEHKDLKDAAEFKEAETQMTESEPMTA